jgi:hypothetical protein
MALDCVEEGNLPEGTITYVDEKQLNVADPSVQL